MKIGIESKGEEKICNEDIMRLRWREMENERQRE